MLGWGALTAFALGMYLLYRWAGHSPTDSMPPFVATSTSAAFRLESATFTGESDGRKTWSVWARQIDVERMPGSALSSIQGATLTDIRNGVLYKAPSKDSAAAVTISNDGLPTGPPAATFRAQHGRYALGNLEPVANELDLLYSVRWQLKLTGSVDLRTAAGDHLQSDALTILEMTNRRTGRLERRVVCDNGVQITLKDAQIHANQARYDPAGRTVECLGGVRGVHKDGTVQADSLFWSLKDQIIRCPETASGVFRGMAGVWTGLTLDLKHRRLQANHFDGEIRTGKGGVPALSGLEEFAMPQTHRSLRHYTRALAGAAVLGTAAPVAGAPPGHKSPPASVPVAPVTPPPGLASGQNNNQSIVYFSGADIKDDGQTASARNIHYAESDRTVTGDMGRYNRKTRQLSAEGHIVLDDPKHHITADRASVDDGKAKLAILNSSVVIVIKPDEPAPGAAPATGGKTTEETNTEEDVASTRKRGAVITCDHVEDYYRKKSILMRGHLVGKQRYRDKDGTDIERTLIAEHAEYDGKTEVLVLFPPVDVRDTQGQEMHFDTKVIVGTKEGAETLESSGAFRGVYHPKNSDEEEQPETDQATPPKPAKTGNTPPPSGKP